MRIAVIGVGAMGSVYAGLLAAAGNEVWAIDSWVEHVEAMRSRGLRVDGASGDRIVRLHATTDPGEAGTVDLVVIATKAADVEIAAASARPLLGPETVVIPIQNGLGSADRVAGVLGEEPVAIGVAGGFGASIVQPGHVHHNGWELIRLGERRGPATPRIERVAESWRAAGFRVQTFDDAGPLVWEKLVCNAAFSGTCALVEATVGEVLENPDAWSVAASCAQEAFEVAQALGIELAFDDPVTYVREFGLKIPDAKPSMLLDLLAGRPCEIDVINGAVAASARSAGVEAPVNEALTALVKAKEAGRLRAVDDPGKPSESGYAQRDPAA